MNKHKIANWTKLCLKIFLNLPTTKILPTNHYQADNCLMTKFSSQHKVLPKNHQHTRNCLQKMNLPIILILPTNIYHAKNA